MPSENWLKLAQDWCCHGTSHLTSAAGVLEPGEKDCFVGEYYIKVHPSTMEPRRLQFAPVRIDRCLILFLQMLQHGQWLGEGFDRS